MVDITRGSIWWINMPIEPNSHVQGGGRPYVVVSNVEDNITSGVVTVCPMSTKLDDFAAHAKVKFRKDAQVLCDQITTIDISKLTEYIGQLSNRCMNEVNETLKYQLCLDMPGDLYEIDKRLKVVEDILTWKELEENDYK